MWPKYINMKVALKTSIEIFSAFSCLLSFVISYALGLHSFRVSGPTCGLGLPCWVMFLRGPLDAIEAKTELNSQGGLQPKSKDRQREVLSGGRET